MRSVVRASCFCVAALAAFQALLSLGCGGDSNPANTTGATGSGGGTATMGSGGEPASTSSNATSSGPGTGGATAGSGGAASGMTHEPAGMVAQIDTGMMATPPAATSGGTWTEGTATFTNFSPDTMSSTGEWAKNISAIPGETGLRINYGPTLDGGNSPVRFGTPIAGIGTGHLYVRWKYRLSPNWTLSDAIGLKVMEPRTLQTTENHVIAFSGIAGPFDGSNMWLAMLLQFKPPGHDTTGINVPGNALGQSDSTSYYLSKVANVGGDAKGTFHLSELYCKPESPAGAGNGELTLWVDGTLVFQTGSGVAGTPSGGTHYFLAGEPMGWNYLMFDPTYGGDQATDHPPTAIYWDIDELYVSTK